MHVSGWFRVSQLLLTIAAADGVDEAVRERDIVLGFFQSFGERRNTAAMIQIKISFSILHQEIVVPTLLNIRTAQSAKLGHLPVYIK